MDRSSFRFACLTLMIGFAPSAIAQGAPRSVGECERLKNDLAYNQCLAMFGPPAKNIAGGDGAGGFAPPPMASVEPDTAAAAGIPSPDDPELAEPNRGYRRGRHARRGGGRQSTSFAIATAGDDAAETTSSRRSRHRYYRRRH